MDSMTYAEAVGHFVRAFRQQHGITLDALAQAGRELGATWSLSSVQAIEGGKAAPTLPTLLTLALVLGRLSGQPIRLLDLVGPAEHLDRPYVVRPDQPVKRTWVERSLSGAPVELFPEDHVHAVLLEEQDWDEELELEALRLHSAGVDGAEGHEQVDSMWEAMNQPPERASMGREMRSRVSLAETRAAKKLGISAGQLQRRAFDLWGRSLELEAAERAGADSSPQARGRVTRVLVDEIRRSVEGEA